MNEIVEQNIQTLLYGNSVETKQAKKTLQKELDKVSRRVWASKVKQDRKNFYNDIRTFCEKLLSEYPKIEAHNKATVLSLLGHALFFYEKDHEHLEAVLRCAGDALKDEKHGWLRHMAVTTATNTRASSRDDVFLFKKKPSKIEIGRAHQHEVIMTEHLTDIFDYLETCIETDEDNFPESIEQMKPSVAKSHLLYLFEFDRNDALIELSGQYEPDTFQHESEYHEKWKQVYKGFLDTHPHVKKFISQVPRYGEYESDTYDDDDLLLRVLELCDDSVPEGILSSEFFSGVYPSISPKLLGGFSIPKDAYFELMEIVEDVSTSRTLRAIGGIVYTHATKAPISEMYWYDVLDSIYSRDGDQKRRVQILEEALQKMKSKINLELPPQQNDVNAIHYGIHEHRPVFRILLSYAMYHHDHGDRAIAQKYYEFLLALNPYDNQGVRYLLSALHTHHPIAYVDGLFEEGNRTQNWDDLEHFLTEQNDQHHFWKEPTE